MEIAGGDAFGYRLPGGGGWGDPMDRDPARVLRDARNGIISIAAARDQYGVVIDPDTWLVDTAATDDLRAGRGGDAKPFGTWDDG